MSNSINSFKKGRKYRKFIAKLTKQAETGRDLLKSMPFKSKSKKLEEELDLLTSYSSDTIYRLRYDSMNYDYISPAIIKLLGFTPEEMSDINFRSLIIETKIISNGIKSVKSFDELEKSRKKGDVNKWQADYLIRTKDGRKIWITDVSYPWFDSDGDIIGSVGSLRDITDRVVAEKKSREEILRMANKDELTGLCNRESFFEDLDKELKRSLFSEIPFSILLLEIDNLSKHSDAHGASTADKITVEVARIIELCIRETDSAARLDGGEFAILLPDTPEDSGYWVADRIRKEVAKKNIFVKDSVLPLKCTVSIGISSASGEEGDAINTSELYKQADTRLYIAKNTGCNQVSIDEVNVLH